MGTCHGHASLGIEESGEVELDPQSPRLAGLTAADSDAALFAASAADVVRVRLGDRILYDGDVATIAGDLSRSIGAVLP